MSTQQRRDRWRLSHKLAALVVSGFVTHLAAAAVPPALEAQLRKIGPIVDPACTAKLYRPLMPAKDITSADPNLYPGIRVVRDQSFGPDPKDVVDIFAADKGPAARAVLIFVPGGAGDKVEIHNRESNAFYDNIGRWATRQGMVAVTMQRHASSSWDGGARDVGAMIQWLQANVAKYKGNPDRMFIWAHSAGNVPVGTYLGHPALYGPKGVGVKGAILMSAAPFNILPAQGPPVDQAAMMKMFASAGTSCGKTGGLFSPDAPLPGKAPGQPGGPPGPPPGGPGAPGVPGGPPNAANQAAELAQSSLPGLAKSDVRIMVVNAELDPGVDMRANDGLTPFNKALNDALCGVGRDRCPQLMVAKGHSHMSVVFSIDTPDTSVSQAVRAFIEAIR